MGRGDSETNVRAVVSERVCGVGLVGNRKERQMGSSGLRELSGRIRSSDATPEGLFLQPGAANGAWPISLSPWYEWTDTRHNQIRKSLQSSLLRCRIRAGTCTVVQGPGTRNTDKDP